MISLLKMWSVGLLVAQVTVKTSLSYLTSLVVNSESQTGKILFAETSCWDKSQWWATKVREVMVFTLNRISLLFICKLFANIPRRQGIRLGQQLKKKKKIRKSVMPGNMSTLAERGLAYRGPEERFGSRQKGILFKVCFSHKSVWYIFNRSYWEIWKP